jgi:hypothetical protein
VIWDSSGGIWGASRHAITVGYVAGMVFAIGQRVLPAFCGMRVLWSTRLMFWSLVLLFTGCFLRVASEPLAYEHIWAAAWNILPISAIIELTAVSVFAVNLVVTLALPGSKIVAAGMICVARPDREPSHLTRQGSEWHRAFLFRQREKAPIR